MSQPVLTRIGQDLYDSVAPLAFDDENHGWPLAYYCDALAQMLQPIDDLVADTPDGPGWSQVVDIDRCPPAAMPWLAQFVGVSLLAGLDDAAQRDRVKTIGHPIGSLASIVGAAQQHLTGTRSVIVRERDSGACPSEPAYGLTVITFTDETPDPTVTEADIRAVKPAGLVLQYLTETGGDFTTLAGDYATFDDARTHFATFDDMRVNP